MTRLPCDCARCTGAWPGGECERRDDCLRYVDTGEGCGRLSTVEGFENCGAFVASDPASHQPGEDQ